MKPAVARALEGASVFVLRETDALETEAYPANRDSADASGPAPKARAEETRPNVRSGIVHAPR